MIRILFQKFYFFGRNTSSRLPELLPELYQNYDKLGGLANECIILIFPANVHHDGNGIMDLQISIFQHGQAHIEAHLHLYLTALFMHDVFKIHLQVVQQMTDGLAFTPDEEVVHLQLLVMDRSFAFLHSCLVSDQIIIINKEKIYPFISNYQLVHIFSFNQIRLIFVVLSHILRYQIKLIWLDEWVIVILIYVIILNIYYYRMRIRSSYFKKDYDLHKAELVGKGTFAQVFRIFDSDLNDSIAIRKVKKSQGDLDDIAKEKLINQQLKKVDNQNILKIYDIIDQPEVVWYITEYCSGGSLWDALNVCKDNKMSEKQSLECILQVSKGVQQLHNHRITHRDLKPQNILLKTKYIPGKSLPLIKLADFGLSTQKIIMQTIAGTKEYIAPEQAKFHNYTNAVDVWSLGIIFDEILHGTPFYSGEDNKQVFNKILKTPFKVRNQDLRTSIKELLASLLKKKPYERPIIAVIRSTIEKILQEIQNAQTQIHRKQSIETIITNDASKGNESKISNNDSKIKIITTPSKQNMVFSKKTYEVNSKQKIQKPALTKEISPVNKQINMFKKAPSTEKKQDDIVIIVKPNSPQNAKDYKEPMKTLLLPETKTNQKRSAVKSDVGDTDRSKIQRKPFLKLESTAKVSQISNIPDKIQLFKSDKRKMINSCIKKEQYKNEIISIAAYSTRMINQRNQLLNTQLKLQKELGFIPNTYLTGNQFTQKCGSSQQCLKQFRKKMDFLNTFNVGQDYEIRLLKGEKQIKQRRTKAEEELYKIQQNVKQIFFHQLDSFIDQYIEKVLK